MKAGRFFIFFYSGSIKAKRLYASSDLAGALRIYKMFSLGFTREEKRVIEIAYESLVGRERFYQMLGIDTAAMVEQSKKIISFKQN